MLHFACTMAAEVHGLVRAKKLFPSVREEHLVRVLQSLELYDLVHEYLSTGQVPRGVDARNFKRTLQITAAKPRYQLIEGIRSCNLQHARILNTLYRKIVQVSLQRRRQSKQRVEIVSHIEAGIVKGDIFASRVRAV